MGTAADIRSELVKVESHETVLLAVTDTELLVVDLVCGEAAPVKVKGWAPAVAGSVSS